jgi:ubiquinone/menaquinone biosynthesis C-methylase UbiE
VPFLQGQEKSVRPGINKDFEDPNIPTFIERFEREGREIYEQRKEIVSACKIKPGSTIADIGAGTGLFTRLLSPVAGPTGRIYAVDISKKFVDHIVKTCEEQGIKNVTPVICTASSAELKPNSVDVAFICDTYHHFEFPLKTMTSIHEALRPGGQVIVVDFVRKEGTSSDWVLNHVRAGQEVFAKEIESCGFKQVEEAKFMKQQYFLRFEKVRAKEGTQNK